MLIPLSESRVEYFLLDIDSPQGGKKSDRWCIPRRHYC